MIKLPNLIIWNASVTCMFSAVITGYLEMIHIELCCSMQTCVVYCHVACLTPLLVLCFVLSCCWQWAAFEKLLYLPCTVGGACPSPMVLYLTQWPPSRCLTPRKWLPLWTITSSKIACAHFTRATALSNPHANWLQLCRSSLCLAAACSDNSVVCL